MIPFYSDSTTTIYHGDCRMILSSLAPANYIIIADPPYTETSLKWDRWPDGWPGAAALVSSSMWCFGSFRMFIDRWGEFANWRMSQEIVWEKHNGSNARRDRFRRVHELAVHFYRGAWDEVNHKTPVTMDARRRVVRRKGRPVHWNNMNGSTFRSTDGGPRLMRSVIYARSAHGKATNPTQKPPSIIHPLLKYAAGPGSVVLDLFSGSGAVLRVAKDMGLPSIGIDIRESECEDAVACIQQEVLIHA